MVISPAWKALRFGFENFSQPAHAALFERRIWWVGMVGSQTLVLLFGFSWLHAQVFFISWDCTLALNIDSLA